jgi:formylglycine-generating enzyme required for sulfatase activity
MSRLFSSIVAVFFAAITFSIQASVQADTFGTSGNEFTIDFVDIGNAGNAADTTTYGAVHYEYRIGKYEISQDAITRATASGLFNVTWDSSGNATTGGGLDWTDRSAGADVEDWHDKPAVNISWYEAAAFVNFLNTSSGKTAAYDLSWSGAAWSMALWSSDQAWTAGGTNLYRNKDAFYFLPSENEWYKAAYHNAPGSSYFLYPTASDTPPIAVAGGADASTAVYNKVNDLPASVTAAGGLSPYNTMGQGGNVWEITEPGVHRGGNFWDEQEFLVSSGREPFAGQSDFAAHYLGFRVASVPEPSTYALLLMTGAGALWFAKRRR